MQTWLHCHQVLLTLMVTLTSKISRLARCKALNPDYSACASIDRFFTKAALSVQSPNCLSDSLANELLHHSMLQLWQHKLITGLC